MSHLEVNLEVLRNNIRIIRKLAQEPLYFILKSNAYGLGGETVVQTLIEEECFKIGVLNIHEALNYKSFFSKGLEVLLMAPFSKEDLPLILKYPQTEPFVGSFSQLENLLNAKENQNWWQRKTPHSVHIKFDLGLSRFGFEEKNLDSIIRFIKKQKFLKIKGVCGHLSKGKDGALSQGETHLQTLLFERIARKFQNEFSNIEFHLFSSSALISYFVHDMEMKWGSRIGGCLYGIKHEVDIQSEKGQKKWKELNLELVSTLKAKLLHVRQISAQQKVSYDGEWKSDKPSVIGIVSVGYDDGLTQYKDHFVFFRGQKVPVIGKICMNFLIIDITNFENPKIGEEVVISNESWSLPDESPYAMMTRIGSHLPRIYKG